MSRLVTHRTRTVQETFKFHQMNCGCGKCCNLSSQRINLLGHVFIIGALVAVIMYYW